MPRRIEVELTSDRGDGTLTWRAAGAKEPKGVLEASLLPAGVSVGDKVKVDADYDMEGVTIVAVLAPTQKKQADNVIEFIGAPPPPPRDYSKEPERRDRKGGRRGDKRDRKGGDGRRERRPGGDRPERPRFERPEKPKLPPKPKAPRLRAGRTHRQALLAGLPEEQRPVAEQVLKGGIPAVRAAIDEQNAAAKEAGQPAVKADALLALAEELVPKARVAEWRDRAEAAIEQVDTVDLRDLRSVVTKAESAAKDEQTRALAEQLRQGLATRLEKEQAAWLAEIGELLEDERVVRALNVSSRPPKAGTPLPPDLADRLVAAAGAALTDQIGAKRWSTVLEALALSPVHNKVEPASVPAQPNDELVAAVTKVSMQVPQIAARFGIEPKPAPRQRGGRGRSRGGRKSSATSTAPAKPKAAPRIPPPPPLAATPVAAPAEAAAEPGPVAEQPVAPTEGAEVAAEVVESAPAGEAEAGVPEPEAPAGDAAASTDAGEAGTEEVPAEGPVEATGPEPAAEVEEPVVPASAAGAGTDAAEDGDAEAPAAAAVAEAEPESAVPADAAASGTEVAGREDAAGG